MENYLRENENWFELAGFRGIEGSSYRGLFCSLGSFGTLFARFSDEVAR